MPNFGVGGNRGGNVVRLYIECVLKKICTKLTLVCWLILRRKRKTPYAKLAFGRNSFEFIISFAEGIEDAQNTSFFPRHLL